MTTIGMVHGARDQVVRVGMVVFALMMLWAIMPMPTHAAGLTDEQVASVVTLLRSFNLDEEGISVVEAVLSGTYDASLQAGEWGGAARAPQPPMPPKEPRPAASSTADRAGHLLDAGEIKGSAACTLFARTLTRGTRGEDVAQLQEFLRKSGDFPEATTTDYFGPITERALQAWQARIGVVASGSAETTGFGSFGPKTRAELAARCEEERKEAEHMDKSSFRVLKQPVAAFFSDMKVGMAAVAEAYMEFF